MNNFVYIDEHGLLGSNFYFRNYAAKGITQEEIESIGLTSDRVQVHPEIIKPLKRIDAEMRAQLGYRLYIKEGYRSKDLYDLVYRKRCEKFGKEETDRIINMRDMPHASGKTVDVALWDTVADKEVFMRGGEDGVDALFFGFYKDKSDPQSVHFQKLQETVVDIMLKHGFSLGTKGEYFHFDYRPNAQS